VPDSDERRSAVRRVWTLLEERFFQLPSGAEPRNPLPVRGPNGRIHSWMVPFVANGKLVAWAQIGRAHRAAPDFALHACKLRPTQR